MYRLVSRKGEQQTLFVCSKDLQNRFYRMQGKKKKKIDYTFFRVNYLPCKGRCWRGHLESFRNWSMSDGLSRKRQQISDNRVPNRKTHYFMIFRASHPSWTHKTPNVPPPIWIKGVVSALNLPRSISCVQSPDGRLTRRDACPNPLSL